MKKILFLMLTLLTSVGAWAQDVNEVKTLAHAWVARINALPEGALTGNKKIDEDRVAFLYAVDALDALEMPMYAAIVNDFLICEEVTPLNGYYRLVCVKDNNQLSYNYFAGGQVGTVSSTEVPAGHYLNVADNPNSAVSVVKLEHNVERDLYTMYVEGQPIKQVTGQYQKFELDATGEATKAQFRIKPVTDANSDFFLTFTLRDISASSSENTYLHGNMVSGDKNNGFVFSSVATAATKASYWYLVPAKTIDVKLNKLYFYKDGYNSANDIYYTNTYASAYFPFPVSINNGVHANISVGEELSVSHGEGGVRGYLLKMKSTQQIPSNTGMIIRGDGDVEQVTLNILSEDPAPSAYSLGGTNLMMTSDELTGLCGLSNAITKVESTEVDGAMEDHAWHYTLGLYKFSSTATLKPNRAYLSTAETGEGAIRLSFDGQEPTGVNQVVLGQQAQANQAIYDLSGRRVAKATKGIYIQGGKKIYVK